MAALGEPAWTDRLEALSWWGRNVISPEGPFWPRFCSTHRTITGPCLVWGGGASLATEQGLQGPEVQGTCALQQLHGL